MCKLFKISSVVLLALFLMGVANDCCAQHKKAKSHLSVRDSLRHTVLKRDSLMRSFKHNDHSLNILLEKIEYYNSSFAQDFSNFSQGFDTLEISEKLPSIEKRMTVMGNLIRNDHSNTLGYLFTIRDLISHFKDDLDTWQQELADDNTKIDKILSDAVEFKKDTVAHTLPTDSSLRIKYIPQILLIQQKWSTLDSAAKKSLIKIGLLQNQVTSQSLMLLDINDNIDQKIQNFANKSLTNEYGYVWENHEKLYVSFDSVASRSALLNTKLLKYFFNPTSTSRINIVSHIATIIVLIIFSGWIYASRRRLVRLKEHAQETLREPHYIVKYSFISALAITSILALYLYNQPPFIFLELLMLVMMVCVGILIKNVWPKPLYKFWSGIFILLIFYEAINLLIQVSYEERIFLLLLSCSSILLGIWFLNQMNAKAETYPPFTKIITILFTTFQGIALFLNIIGRFSVAKLISVTTIFNLCLGIGFYLFIQILMESLFLQLEANKSENSNFSSYIDFKIIQKKFKDVLVKLFAVLWIVKLLENLDIDDYVYSKVGDFLTHSYNVGKTTFTFGSIVIFVFVLWLSVIISRVISYFYDYAEQQIGSPGSIKKSKTSILLIRLSVFSVGFIAAIVFSGIPLTEVTIVVGALGVGIGFGLQNIVNNLVSGVILAFEKPVQVGDIIEVGNRSGTIREIGIRASKIEAGDGSELIVPNGDLISQHVINWTLSNNNRRVELIVGVAYGSDIEKVEGILKRIVRDRTDIMQNPVPLVFLHNFSDSSVDFRLLFWAAEIGKWLSLKSNVMSEVYTEFAKQGIEIPHPKRDIQVFFPEGTSAEIKKADDNDTAPSDSPPKENLPGQAQ